MKINMNKDIDEAFPEEFYAGFTMKQCASIAVGFMLAAVVAFFLWKYLGIGIVECTYIAVPVMIPCCGIGFYEFQKQTPIELLKALYYTKKTAHLTYGSDEYDNYCKTHGSSGSGGE